MDNGQLLWYGLALIAGIGIGFLIRFIISKQSLLSAEQKSKRIIEDAQREAESRKKEVILEAKDALFNDKKEFEREVREQRNEVKKLENRLMQKEENLEKRVEILEKKEDYLSKLERETKEKELKLKESENELLKQLERISGLRAEEARKKLLAHVEEETKHEAIRLIHRLEDEARQTADKKSQEILVATMQRVATDITSEISVSSVALPNDEMKGRIIGREGRNIRMLETLTGVDVIIDDTPEAVIISCFDPVRREIARRALERLMLDGRIHPARIEEVVKKVTDEVEKIVLEEGEKLLFDFHFQDVHLEIRKKLGRLKYRTSYGQNVLDHSREVGNIAGMIAGEINADSIIAQRAGLLHDIGKAITVEGEGAHAIVGMEFLKKYKEKDIICNAVGAHHNEMERKTIYDVIVQIADAISASRPGARRETIENYLKRLKNLEEIAHSFNGVEKCFAIQAGRELRIMVNHDIVNDDESKRLAREVATKIEQEMTYPGQVKVTLIRETRIVEYAK